MKSERRQISLKLPTWRRIRALADAEEHDCFMGDMMGHIVDDWCKTNGWRFVSPSRAVGNESLVAKLGKKPLDLDTLAAAHAGAGAGEMADLPGTLG